MRWQLRVGWAVVVALAVGGCGSAAAPREDAASPPEPPLVGTEWQLASYRAPGATDAVAVTTDSTLSFSARNRFSARACNGLSGAARVAADRVTFGRVLSTLMACGGEQGVLNRMVGATLTTSTGWSIRAGTLTLAGARGHILTYRVRPSVYPSLTARALLTGDRPGGHFRLAVEDSAGHLFLTFESRTGPGEAWGRSGIAAPEPEDCLANHLMSAGRLGREDFVVAWATREVAKVTVRATPDAPETALTFHPVPGSDLRVAARWTTDFRPGTSPVTFYDRRGAVLAAYPDGPC